MTLKQFSHNSRRVLFIILLLSVVNVGVFLVWIITGPRSVPFLGYRIENALNDLSPDYKVKIKETVLEWPGWKDNVGIHLKNTVLINKENEEVATIPDMAVNLQFLYLLAGQVRLKDLAVNTPVIYIKRPTIDKDFYGPPLPSTAMDYKAIYQKIALGILTNIKRNNYALPVENIFFNNGRLVVAGNLEEVVWQFPEGYLSFMEVEGRAAYRAEINIISDQSGSLVTSSGFLNEQGGTTLHFEASNIPSQIVTDLFPYLQWMEKNDIRLNGDADIIFEASGKVASASFHALTRKNKMALEAWIKLIGVENNKTDSNAEQDFRITGNALVTNISMPELQYYWPDYLAVDARDWILRNIRKGFVPEASIIADMLLSNIKSGNIPPDAIEAQVQFKDLEVDYAEGDMPLLTHAKGVAIFTTNAMNLSLERGNIKEADVTGNVAITDMVNNPAMEIKGHFAGKLEELVEFFTVTADKNRRSVDKIKNATGKATSDFTFRFPVYVDLKPEEILVSATASIEEASIHDVTENMDLSGGIFTAKVENSLLNIEGKAFLNQTQANIKFSEREDEKNKGNYIDEYLIGTYVTNDELVQLGFPKNEILRGAFAVKVAVTESGNTRDVVAKIDAADGEINVAPLGFLKPIGARAELELSFQ